MDDIYHPKNGCELKSVVLGREASRKKSSAAPSCSAVTRKAFICVGCDAVYADEPVTACDCCIDLDHPKGTNLFIEGQITYTKQNSPGQQP